MAANHTDEVLQRMYAAQQPQGGLTKEAEAQVNAQVADAFLGTMLAAGWDQAGLEKYASENPQGYSELFNQWLVKTATEIQQAEVQASLVKQAEAEKMTKLAEDIFAGRVMAHAFVDEVSNIFGEMQKMAADEEKKDEEKKDEEKEKDEKKDEKKDKEEKKEEGKGAIPPQFLAQKQGALLPLPPQVAGIQAQLEKIAEQRPLTKEERKFLSMCDLAEAGYSVQWQ